MSDDQARALRRHGAPLPDALIDPHESRHEPAADRATVTAHRAAVREGLDGYVDPLTGLFCFTARYHWDKGECCELGCRHCPWIAADDRLGRMHMHPDGSDH